MATIKEIVNRWRFDTFSGHFELGKADWVYIQDASGNKAILHKDQIYDMAETLREMEETPKEISHD